ncbi:MAG: DNA-binding protein [gamma proteobacterium symbiont of Lucinoma myriamae]|nr:DNA-binding protein [gamma proteobacterium symbiont of Lucinoma myriamae]
MVAAVISQEDVNQVCIELSATGKNVNISTVFDVLGKGGPNTIKKYIAVWRDTQTDDESGKDLATISQDLPEAYTNQVMILGKTLFNAAEQEMQATVTRINAEKEEAIAKAEEELKEVADVAEQLNSKNNELEKKLTEHKAISDTKLDESLANIANLNQDIDNKDQELRKLESTTIKQSSEIESLTITIRNKEILVEEANKKQVGTQKALNDSESKLSSTQTELKILMATAQEKEKYSKVKIEEATVTINDLQQDLKDKNNQLKVALASESKLQHDISTLNIELSNITKKHQSAIKEIKLEHENSYEFIEKTFQEDKKSLKENITELKTELRHSNNELIKEGRISGDMKGQMIQLEKQLKGAIEKLEVKKPVVSKKKAVTKNKT